MSRLDLIQVVTVAKLVPHSAHRPIESNEGEKLEGSRMLDHSSEMWTLERGQEGSQDLDGKTGPKLKMRRYDDKVWQGL